MEKILFLAHTETDGRLPKAALEVFTVAKGLAKSMAGSELFAGIIGRDGATASPDGVAKAFAVSGADFSVPRYGTDAAAAEALCRAAGASIVVAPATSRLCRVMAGVAARLGAKFDSHATAVSAGNGTVRVSRWFYRQRMEGVISRSSRPWVILVEPGVAEASAAAAGGGAEEVGVSVTQAAKATEVTGISAPSAGEQTIRPDAGLLFVAGAGWTKKQADGRTHADRAAVLILDFLKKSQASLGGSKSVVDISGEGQAVLPFMTHLNQIGQTGSTPRHPKGLATCCHGEEPHTVGWRFVNARRAVNTDPNCGWAQGKADVLYVADAFEVMAKVSALLE